MAKERFQVIPMKRFYVYFVYVHKEGDHEKILGIYRPVSYWIPITAAGIRPFSNGGLLTGNHGPGQNRGLSSVWPDFFFIGTLFIATLAFFCLKK